MSSHKIKEISINFYEFNPTTIYYKIEEPINLKRESGGEDILYKVDNIDLIENLNESILLLTEKRDFLLIKQLKND